MGKKSGRSNGGDKQDGAAAKPTAFVLKVTMHCRCNGCDDKIRAGVKDLTLHNGIEALDQSALWTKGELRVASTADPEKLRRRLNKATGKKVELQLPKPQQADKDAAAEKEVAAMEALLRRTLQQQQQQPVQYGHAQVLPGWSTGGGYGYGAAPQASYPWAVQAQQQQQLEAYPSYHSAYPPSAYAYPPAAAHQGHGAYCGGGWHGYGAY